jgi:hypothetical protein
LLIAGSAPLIVNQRGRRLQYIRVFCLNLCHDLHGNTRSLSSKHARASMHVDVRQLALGDSESAYELTVSQGLLSNLPFGKKGDPPCRATISGAVALSQSMHVEQPQPFDLETSAVVVLCFRVPV